MIGKGRMEPFNLFLSVCLNAITIQRPFCWTSYWSGKVGIEFGANQWARQTEHEPMGHISVGWLLCLPGDRVYKGWSEVLKHFSRDWVNGSAFKSLEWGVISAWVTSSEQTVLQVPMAVALRKMACFSADMSKHSKGYGSFSLSTSRLEQTSTYTI